MNKQNSITVSAPGKIHLMGEHAVVYGKPALLAAINMRCNVQLIPSRSDGVTIISKNFKKQASYSQKDIDRLKDESDKKWKAFQKHNDISFLTSQIVDLPAIAIGETLGHLRRQLPSGFDLIIDSAIPVGSGLGSSAAFSVAIVASVMRFMSQKIDKEMVNSIAFRVEQKTHGAPSGGDNTVSCYGGMLLFQNKIFTKNVGIPKSNFFLVDSGKPVESTGEMVSLVKGLQRENKSMFEAFLQDQEKLTNDLLSFLEQGNGDAVSDLIKRGEHNLEKIGVVSDFAKSLVGMIEKEGGAAKISGAGGRKKGSGMLLVYHPEKRRMQEIFLSKKLSFYDIILGSEGVMVN